ncbi:hypothetical protein IHQ71_26605 [Rhizobium sp. TH2]|uniref:hypothetical protein n=1 Tax=Rhizobium sp. TH2 TaxID=2775403 RepID=UPI002157F3A7|nr:hypothetical protein [Rhizobium sp. TH2]UVC08657.1 hypothetical protein IHQ71_26605 [Rhizobium sp. TH2]
MTYGISEENLAAMDPDLRAFALVGAFMGFFALLEQGINQTIGEVLEVDGAARTIVTRNMTFDDKVKTLRALVAALLIDKDAAKNFDDLALRARKASETRNVVAHTAFRRSPKTDGVEFFAITATKSLKFPDMDWPVEEFLRQIEEINDIDNQLRSMESKMTYQRVAKALMNPSSAGKLPSSLFGGLFGLGKSLTES